MKKIISTILAIMFIVILGGEVLAMPNNTPPIPMSDYFPDKGIRLGELDPLFEIIPTSDSRNVTETITLLPAQFYYGNYGWTTVKVSNNESYTETNPASYSRAYTLSNSYTTTLSFSSSVVSAGVGFSVTASITETFADTVNVPPRRTGYIKKRDVYYVKPFTCQRVTRVWGGPGTNYHYYTDNGTGSAWQYRYMEGKTGDVPLYSAIPG